MTVRPVRLRLSRAPGSDLQRLSRETNGLPAVVVARPSKWGNPFPVDVYGREGAVDRFRRLMLGPMSTEEMSQSSTCTDVSLIRTRSAIRDGLAALRGRNLACWCGEGPCHADVLLALACGAPEAGSAAA